MTIKTMAALTQGADLVPWHFDPAPLGPFDCLVKTLSCGLCRSDVHMIDNDWTIARYPLVPGHELIGEVVEKGTSVSDLKLGDRVGIGWQRSACLKCRECLRAHENLCPELKGLIVDYHGGYASHVVADSRFCFRMPAGLGTETAGPLLCGGVTVYSALQYAGLGSGQEIGVVGLGGLGSLAVQFASKLGNRVTAYTRTKDKAADAVRLGASEAILLADGRPTDKPSRPLDIVISTVPRHMDWSAILDQMSTDSTLTFVAIPPDPLTLGLDKLLFQRRRIMSSNIGSRAMIAEVLSIAERFGIEPVVERFPLTEVNRAIAKLRAHQIRYRAVLIP